MEFQIICYLITTWIVALLGACYLYTKNAYSYWKRNNIPYVEPTFPYGNLKVVNRKEHLSQRLAAFYRRHKHNGPMLGLYFFFEPMLLITDLELVRKVLVTDFKHFQERATIYHKASDPLAAHIFNQVEDEWKQVRPKLTPSMTTSKIKYMFPSIVSVADDFVCCLRQATEIDAQVEIGQWLTRYTIDVTGTCILGIECHSLHDPNLRLLQIGRKVFDVPKIDPYRNAMIRAFGSVAQLIGFRIHHKDVTDYFSQVVREVVNYRESNNIHRKDVMNLLIDMKNGKKAWKKLTMDEMTAQAFMFFLASFETSSAALKYCLYELSLEANKHIQRKARTEIKNVLEKYDGQLTYAALSEMKYIEQIIKEALRKHPISSELTRTATQSYKVPNTDFIIPKGMRLRIPVYAIHHDPEIYENPECFMPERFSSEEQKKRPSCSYLIFGKGPRGCFGFPLGMLVARIGLVRLLHNFEVSTCNRTEIPLKYNPDTNLLETNEVWINFKNIHGTGKKF